MTVAAVVLAAGASRRLGRSKQDVVIGGTTLLDRAVETSVFAALAPVFVVVRDLTRYRGRFAPPVVLVENEEVEEGMAVSVRLGAAAAVRAGVEGAVILTCDQPLLRPEHLRALSAVPNRITCSGYGSSRGVPAFFPAKVLPDLLRLQGDQGARGLLKRAAVLEDEDLALDVDTPEALSRAEQLFHAREKQGTAGT